MTDGYLRISRQAPTFTHPSHPPSLEGNEPNLDLVRDPKGWIYSAYIEYDYFGDTPASVLFPNLGVWLAHRHKWFAWGHRMGHKP